MRPVAITVDDGNDDVLFWTSIDDATDHARLLGGRVVEIPDDIDPD